MAKEKVEIVETAKFKTSGCAALVAFPGVGMSGNIALTHLIDKPGMKEVGHIKSPETPHVVLVHKNRPAYPIRIYAGKSMIALVSELPVLSHATEELNKALIDWFKEKKIKRVYLLGGFPNAKKVSQRKSEVYGIPSDKETEAMIKKFKLKPIKEGAVFGEEGLLLLAAMESKIPALYILSDAFVSFPDPGSASAIIETLNRILGTKVEYKSLSTKGEEIKKKFNTLMQQTKQLLEKKQMPPPPEKGMSPMYR